MDGSNAHSARTADYARWIESLRAKEITPRQFQDRCKREPELARYVAANVGVDLSPKVRS